MKVTKKYGLTWKLGLSQFLMLLPGMDRHNQTELKGKVFVGRTINLGNFNSVKLELGCEFLLDETSHEETLGRLLGKMEKALKDMGVVPRYD